MNRNNVDPTLTKYLDSIVAIALNIALVLGILGYFGIQTTSFAALLAGAFMLLLRPIKVGDFVSIGGTTGTVLEMRLEEPVIAVRPYTHTDHYWQVYFETNEAVVRVCREAGWPVPAVTQIHRVLPQPA